jgi:hypothetical protein
MAIFSALFLFFRSLFFSRISLATEILVLRQQLLVLNRTVKRPNLRPRDRLFWVCLSRLWKDWRDALIIVKPDTVIKWHREGFRLYWRWKSKAPIGRPTIDKEIRELIRRISSENPLWGAPRIQSELRLLGLNVTEKTVAKYRVKHAKPALADLEDISCQSCESDCGRRFFHNPDDQFPRFVLLHCPPSRSQEDRSFQCDHESDSPMGRTANHRSISR